MSKITLTPAYGRDYKTAQEALKDYNAGKDFTLNSFGDRWDGRLINKEQIISLELQSPVVLRFNGLRNTCSVF